MNRFEGKVALITGAASGIGRSVAQRLADEGGTIFAVDVNREGLTETESIIKGAGGNIQTAICDVTNRANCFEAVDAAVTAFGKLDVLGNVAGIVKFSSVTSLSEEDWRLIHAVNLDGPFFLSQAAIPHLIESEGNIVNIASSAGLMGQAYTSAYCSSKAALVNLTRSMAIEYIHTKMRVNAIAPGGVVTTLTQTIEFPADMNFDLMQRYVGLRGMCEPQEIAGAFAYLASNEAKNVHGTIFSIDGGSTAG
ncbi:MAG: SDR family oxidoreductase [bacterium]|nr:SDR family oxidoreductase [bacterium]